MTLEEEQAKADAEIASAKATEEAEAQADAKANANPSPLKIELDKVQGKKVRTEAEKAAYSLLKNAERAKELGLDPKKVLGLSEEEENDDDQPITRGELKKLESENAQRTALSEADEIQDETERELVKHHLVNTVRPSGNAKQDLSNARAIVNSVKNQQIAEEAQRKTTPKRNSSGAGAPAKESEIFEPTPEEMVYMRQPFNLSQTQIMEARKKVEASQA